MSAFYLVGSIALGAFDPRRSDIDFVAVLCRPPSQADFEALDRVHKGLKKQFPQWIQEGNYFQPADLGRMKDLGPCLSINEHGLQPPALRDECPVTWWILKHHGIAVFGPAPETLPFEVDEGEMLRWMQGNLNSYWANWLRQPARLAVFWSDWGIQWTALGVLRQFYTFREHNIVSKTAAGEYGLTCLPPRWHRIIREALRIRKGERGSLYRFRIQRTVEGIRFLKYMIEVGNEAAEGETKMTFHPICPAKLDILGEIFIHTLLHCSPPA